MADGKESKVVDIGEEEERDVAGGHKRWVVSDLPDDVGRVENREDWGNRGALGDTYEDGFGRVDEVVNLDGRFPIGYWKDSTQRTMGVGKPASHRTRTRRRWRFTTTCLHTYFPLFLLFQVEKVNLRFS